MKGLPLKKIVEKIILPTISYSRKNLTVKDEDEELSSAIMREMKTDKSSYENYGAIDWVSSTNQAFMMKSSKKRAVNNEDNHKDPPPSFPRPPKSSQGQRVYTWTSPRQLMKTIQHERSFINEDHQAHDPFKWNMKKCWISRLMENKRSMKIP